MFNTNIKKLLTIKNLIISVIIVIIALFICLFSRFKNKTIYNKQEIELSPKLSKKRYY